MSMAKLATHGFQETVPQIPRQTRCESGLRMWIIFKMTTIRSVFPPSQSPTLLDFIILLTSAKSLSGGKSRGRFSEVETVGTFQFLVEREGAGKSKKWK